MQAAVTAMRDRKLHGAPTSDRPACIARLAMQAMVAEAQLTPKPGLVDRRGSGTHTDLSLEIMYRSACSIEPYLTAMALVAGRRPLDHTLREQLATIGREAERAMYLATGGVNAHKGAIWALGLFAAAASIAPNHARAAELGALCARIASFEDRSMPQLVSHGYIVGRIYGVSGARGEAQQGFPHVVEVGLPALRGFRERGETEPAARLDTLLTIMSRLDDTCVLYRGSTSALEVVRRGSQRVLDAGGCATQSGRQHLRVLDQRLLTLGISPGGSADLLAATLLVDALERGMTNIEEDTSLIEGLHGAD